MFLVWAHNQEKEIQNNQKRNPKNQKKNHKKIKKSKNKKNKKNQEIEKIKEGFVFSSPGQNVRLLSLLYSWFSAISKEGQL